MPDHLRRPVNPVLQTTVFFFCFCDTGKLLKNSFAFGLAQQWVCRLEFFLFHQIQTLEGIRQRRCVVCKFINVKCIPKSALRWVGVPMSRQSHQETAATFSGSADLLPRSKICPQKRTRFRNKQNFGGFNRQLPIPKTCKNMAQIFIVLTNTPTSHGASRSGLSSVSRVPLSKSSM